MKYTFLAIIIVALLISCRPYLLNLGLESLGVYNDKVTLSMFEGNEKDIVFIPMHHAGTELFYADVKEKIDSLKERGYFFYWEITKSEKMDSLKRDTLARKLRKITGIHYFKNDFNGILDSLLNGKKEKLKKQLINQPSYWELGVDSLYSKNVDATMSQMVSYYNKKYGVIELESCDFVTKLSEISVCKKLKNQSEVRNEIVLNFRNQVVLDEIDNETRNKITIIYGENHLKGIKEGLLERGYKEITPPQ